MTIHQSQKAQEDMQFPQKIVLSSHWSIYIPSSEIT